MNSIKNTENVPVWERLLDSDDINADLRDLYDPYFQADLLQIAGLKAPNRILTDGAKSAVRSYLHVRHEMKRRKPGKMETRHIERVCDAAHSLYLALSKIENHRNVQLKLASAITDAITEKGGRGADLLRVGMTRHGVGDPFRALKEISEILAEASAPLVNKEVGGPSDDCRERGYEIQKAELADWSLLERKTETLPVTALVKAFRPSWEQCSDHPYTEGMYRKDIRRTVSPAVDAVLLIGRKIDSKLSRQRVVTAFRNVASV